MEYSDDFYYLDEQELDGFSSKPPGRLSVSRLIKGEPCWKKTVRQNVQNKKTVIIDDWTAPAWSYQKKAAVQLKINALIADGFSVYAWSDGALVNLSAHELCFSDQQKMTPVSMNEIIEVAASHQLSSDKIHVLDDYGITCLLSEENIPPKRVLHLSDYLHSEFNKTKLLAWLQQVTPKIDVFELDILSLERLSGIAEIIEASLPGIEQRISEAYIEDSRFVDPAYINETTLSIKCSAEQVNASAMLSIIALVEAPGESRVPNLRSFHVEDAQNWSFETGNHIVRLLEQSEHFEHLTLNNWPHWGRALTTLYRLKHLASLDISGSNLDLWDLTLMLQGLSTELRELKLSHCKRLTEKEFHIFEPLHHLESLNLNDAVISAEALTTLLENTPNLRELHLRGIPDDVVVSAFLAAYFRDDKAVGEGLPSTLEILTIDCLALLDGEKFKKLSLSETMHYDNYSCHSLVLRDCQIKSMHELIGDGSKLKELKLKNCTIDIPFDDMMRTRSRAPYQYFKSSLESLTLDGGNSIEFLPDILTHSPNLHTLVLKNCKLTPEILARFPSNLSNIQQLDIDENISITANGLKKLLNAFPNLTDPSLSKCINLLKSNKLSGEINRTEIATNPVHNPDTMFKKAEKPPEHFKFKGINTQKNQDMIIEKLSQYLTMKNNPSLIPHIQKGICRGLSYWYMSQLHDEFFTKINSIAEWDGRAEADEALSVVFKEIIMHIKAHQLNQKTSHTYLGNQLEQFISTMTAPCILNNPWPPFRINNSGLSTLCTTPSITPSIAITDPMLSWMACKQVSRLKY